MKVQWKKWMIKILILIQIHIQLKNKKKIINKNIHSLKIWKQV